MRVTQDHLRAFLAGAVLLSLQTGCGQPALSPDALAHTRLDRLGLLYGQYAGQHRGQPPGDMAALKHFAAQEIAPAELSELSAANLAEVFVSPRDGQPFGFVALPKMPIRVANVPPPLVLYEQQGADGRRIAVYLGGGTSEFTADEFAAAVPSAARTVVAYGQ